jgi:tetratricopeptide (TPR) repeat protein
VSNDARPETVGARVRSLRKAAGLTQAKLAGGRFSTEYMSQIELGKTQPNRETLEWIADRLETDPEFLEHGLSAADAERVEAKLREAELLLDRHRSEDALRAFADAAKIGGGAAHAAVSLRVLRGEAWARIREGEVDQALALLEDAARLALGAEFTDVDRAGIVFEVGVCRYSQSRVSEAVVLFDQAEGLATRSGLPCDLLLSDIFHWRSRCHRRNRDWVAAGEDVERALELADASSDRRRAADALFQASLVAQRQGRWVLARTYTQQAKDLFDELGDRPTVGRLLNNLAGLEHLLGNSGAAVSLLHEAFEIFVESDLSVDAGYVCSSLAGIQLARGDAEAAETDARKALTLLDGRVDHLQEVGMAELSLGRALAAQGQVSDAEEWIAAADRAFEQARSVGHRSEAWMAQGDIESARGADREAADLYRRAAVALREERE